MSPTPIYGLRFPDSADDLNVGAINIQQLAEDVEAAVADLTRPRYFGSSDGAATLPAAGGPVPLTFTAPVMSADFTLDGSGTFATYVGDAGRWFTWTGAANIVSTSAVDSVKALALVRNAAPAPDQHAFGSQCGLSLTTIVQLWPGDMLWVTVDGGAVDSVAGSGYMTLLGGV